MTEGIAGRIAIVGIGNPMMADDGIGPRLISELEGSATGVDLIDMGTGGMQLVHVLAKYDSVLIIDSAYMGLSPGESRTFSPEEVVSLKETRAYSLHDWDLMRSIEMSRNLGEAPDRILIFAVQPGSLEMREGLSAEVEKRMPTYIEHLRKAVKTLSP
ncbi:hydrogenase maturation protease [Chloroflexota bacterium]